MGNLSRFLDAARPAAHRIESEEEAGSIAAALARDFAASSLERDVNRVLAFAEMDRLSVSGLLGISIPAEHGGLDISNGLLAEIVARISEGDSGIGQALAAHFCALDGLRGSSAAAAPALYAGALKGERFAIAPFPASAFQGSGPGLTLQGRSRSAPGLLYAEWIAVFGERPTGPALAYLPRATEGLDAADDWDGFGQRVNGAATLRAERIALPLGLPAAAEADGKAESLPLLLEAAVDLGIARAAMADLARHAASDLPVALQAEPVLKIEAATALIARAGDRLDRAQVDPGAASEAAARFCAAAARLSASQAALTAAERIFDLSSTDARSLTLDLDRHWRNARVTAPDPTAAAALGRLVIDYREAGDTPESAER